MPWQLQLKMKDGAIRAQLPGQGPVPEVGNNVKLHVEGGPLIARVTAVHPTPVGQNIGQQLFIVEAEEI